MGGYDNGRHDGHASRRNQQQRNTSIVATSLRYFYGIRPGRLPGCAHSSLRRAGLQRLKPSYLSPMQATVLHHARAPYLHRLSPRAAPLTPALSTPVSSVTGCRSWLSSIVTPGVTLWEVTATHTIQVLLYLAPPRQSRCCVSDAMNKAS
ncbi:hypothetical protein LIA77_09372 [Sarocladium implicatum]|nr:hypothetical protein LIA77_09372 [Sarocladium implicatum]